MDNIIEGFQARAERRKEEAKLQIVNRPLLKTRLGSTSSRDGSQRVPI
jgi:hypothetical protein